ncbi:MAG: ion transporter [Cytophagales bacterium]|nr:MAG: ion transporter [Cytophagales bacterium]
MDNHREKLAIWVESDKIQTWIVSIIIFNAFMLGLQTSDYLETNFAEIFDWLDVIIPAIFFIEIILKIYAFDYKFFKSVWNIFDLIIVIICLLPESGPLRVLRTLRILRVLMLVRKLPRLRILVEAFLESFLSSNWVIMLLLVVFYIYGLIGTLMFGPTFDIWFGTLGRTLFSLFQIMTLESWSEGIARPVIKEFPLACVYFITFILISLYTILNIFIVIMITMMQKIAFLTEKYNLESKSNNFLNIPKNELEILNKENEIILLLKNILERLDKIESNKS